MSEQSVQEFVEQTKKREKAKDTFHLETDRILEVTLSGDLWAKTGAMISYTGDIRFEREGLLEHGASRAFKKTFTNEGSELMKASGEGNLFLSDQGKKITILDLQNESIRVNGNDLLAFEPTVDWDIFMMRKVAGMMSGGLFNILLEGRGRIAITTYYEPLTLMVEPGKPVRTDPNATVAWSGDLEPEFRTDVNYKTFLGRGSGESIQMEFEGWGFVIVQPCFEGTMNE
ncbi:AIM24 family protein [Alteribacter natronophilus]|uniref:AIM24 family protein n=1 Tax=Alteribacter natronophilus TaxID=2583810 RepID=UPI00110D3439|nr:AIM24 family protein [Alteribacter natronophilus]TMW70095.1 AIM24 family protein [Alteribacter natronophilus]